MSNELATNQIAVMLFASNTDVHPIVEGCRDSGTARWPL